MRRDTLYGSFRSETQADISPRHFRRLVKKGGKVVTRKTGGMDRDLRIVARVKDKGVRFRISAWNTLAVDEKPFVFDHYVLTSVIIPRDAPPGPFWSQTNRLPKLRSVYLLMAISVNGVMLHQLFDRPIKTDDYNCFIYALTQRIQRDGNQRWLLHDNASFHKLNPVVEEAMAEVGIGETHTAPGACFMNPIENVFGLIDAIFGRKYAQLVVDGGGLVPGSQARIEELIIEALQEVCGYNFAEIYARAGLPVGI
jgi:hypothetical protein